MRRPQAPIGGEMLQTAATRIGAKPTADLDGQWGKGLFSGGQWVRLVAAAP